MFNAIHHVAIICSDYPTSKRFYTEVLGLQIIAENYREARTPTNSTLRCRTEAKSSCSVFPAHRSDQAFRRRKACDIWRFKSTTLKK